jgi:mRNA interferase MazF
MAINEHPLIGTLLLCNFTVGFKVPEMDKVRPVVVISPKIAARPYLCTVVALSTTAPNPVLSFHAKLELGLDLPAPWDAKEVWVKGDMVNAVGFHRLDFFRLGKDVSGKRKYQYGSLSSEKITIIRSCVLKALGMSNLTKHL